jgi:hypothetical protein
VFFSWAARTIKPLDRCATLGATIGRLRPRVFKRSSSLLRVPFAPRAPLAKDGSTGHLRRVNRAASGALPASTRHRKSAVPREKT